MAKRNKPEKVEYNGELLNATKVGPVAAGTKVRRASTLTSPTKRGAADVTAGASTASVGVGTAFRKSFGRQGVFGGVVVSALPEEDGDEETVWRVRYVGRRLTRQAPKATSLVCLCG